MRDVASAWLVTELTRSAAAVALIQAAATLPVFLLALPAGALSDIVDRRKYLIANQLCLATISTVLTVLAATGKLSVNSLVLLTFLGGVTAALIGPTWQAIVPELISKDELKGAIALNSLGFNIARAIGPAVGGVLLALAGAAVTYGLNVLTYLFVIAALLWWRRAPNRDDQLTERFGGAMRAGVRFALASPELRRVLFRASVFFMCANVVWALMPMVARQVLAGDARFYGVMLGATGAGAVAGALILSRVRARLSVDNLVLAAALVMAAVLICLSVAPPRWGGIVATFAFGAAWIAVLISLNATTQAILPNWVRGRGLATYLMVISGAMTASSLIWGAIAEYAGIRPSLFYGGILLTLVALFLHRFKLPTGEADLTPSLHWPEPPVAEAIAHDRGPVLITVEYKVARERRAEFLAVACRLSGERRRDGAYGWGVAEDTSAPETILEWFFVESWAEHLRQHRRVSKADAQLQAELGSFHLGDTPPKVSHYLALTREAPGSDLQSTPLGPSDSGRT
jgi:MFS family permease